MDHFDRHLVARIAQLPQSGLEEFLQFLDPAPNGVILDRLAQKTSKTKKGDDKNH